MSELLHTIIIAGIAAGCASTASTDPAAHPSDLPLCYHNARYDFTFFLPATWHGYSVLVQRWTPAYSTKPEHGPMVVLRHPRWKAGHPYHDIRILVFTRSQWQADMQGNLSIGAGGVEFELVHNNNYVFATSSRAWADELNEWEAAERAVERNRAFNEPHLFPQ
jgi:hypothetical protein